jgi:23S rRNA (guanosine2251-2'-O)-methyltransferase
MKGRKLVNVTRRTSTRRDLLHGLYVIEGWLKVRPSRLRRLYVTNRPSAKTARLLDLADHQNIAVERVEDHYLSTLSGTARHQGVVAWVYEFPYSQSEAVLQLRPPVVLVVDRIQDPRNLGAILRTAVAVQAGAVALPKDGSVEVTATVESAAAGAAAHIPICRVTNLVRFVGQLKALNYWAVALEAQGETSLYALEPPQLTAVVVGGEGGVRPLLLKSCDQVVTIPMPGPVESLNVSVATAVFLYELHRRRAGTSP